MNKNVGTTWPIEPHTEAKHEILRYYLGAWFPILATTQRRLLYIDGFAGPGEYEGGEDGSPIIALKVARDHVLKSKLQRPDMELVFIFIEKDKERYENLQRKVAELQLPSNFKIDIEWDTFECAFDSILKEVEEQSERLAPSFVFIDPFGPTGFPMSLIGRLAQQRSSEVLITFNYQAINQWFLNDPSKHKRLDELYGSNIWCKCLDIPITSQREECLRETYQNVLEDLGWKVRAFRMINKHNQTQYYLFFATSNWLGMLVMKQAMWSAAPIGDFTYSDLTNPQQACLFEKVYDEEYSKQLAYQIYEARKGQTLPKHAILQNELAWHPICIGRHLTKALDFLENELTPSRIVKVEVPNRKRKGKTYPEDCVITFATQ